MRGKIQDVAHGGGAKAVDRLGVVADHGETAPVRLEPQQDLRLERVGILIFVDQDEVEAGRDVRGDRTKRHHVRPVKQQIVVIEHPLRALGERIGAKQLSQLARPLAAPGECLQEQRRQLDPGIRGIRVDREASRLLRKAPRLVAEAQFVAHQIHQIRGVAAVEHGEGGIEADRLGIEAQQPARDRMKGARPGDAAGDVRATRPADPLDPPRHLLGRAPGEGQKQHAPRVGTAQDQMGDAMRQRVGLARPRPGDDQERPAGRGAAVRGDIERHRRPLGFVQRFQMRGFRHTRGIAAKLICRKRFDAIYCVMLVI